MLRNMWIEDDATAPVCSRFAHRAVVVHARLATDAGPWKVERCGRCGSMRYTDVK